MMKTESLSEELAASGLIDVEVEERLADIKNRNRLVVGMMALFVISNIVVLGLISWAFLLDIDLLKAEMIGADGRLITPGVVMAVTGATTVQLGAVIVTIASYLFRRQGSGGHAGA